MTTLSDFKPGTTVDFSVTITKGGAAQDVTDDTVTFYLKTAMGDDDNDALITASGDVSGGSEGVTSFSIPYTDTASLTPGQVYPWGIKWVTAGGKVAEPFSGQVTIKERVTDAS